MDPLGAAVWDLAAAALEHTGRCSLGGGIALFLLNFVFAGLIGGCVLVWRLLVAAWYVPLTLYRLLTAGCACIITED